MGSGTALSHDYIIILHYIAINKFSSRMGIRICTHGVHDHLCCYDDEQIGTRMGSRTALSHDHIANSAPGWGSVASTHRYAIIYFVMMINKSAAGWDHAGTALSHDQCTALYSDQHVQQKDGDQDRYTHRYMIIYFVMIINKSAPGSGT
jgi:hypothetical protein